MANSYMKELQGKMIVSDTTRSRDTGMALVLVCLLLFLVWPESWLIVAAMTLQVVTMSRPVVLSPLSRPWFAVAHYMGNIVSFTVLTAIFFLLVTPVAWIRHLVGADAMQGKKWQQGDASVFICREHCYQKEDLERPY